MASWFRARMHDAQTSCGCNLCTCLKGNVTVYAAQALYMLHRHCICCTGAVFCCTDTVSAAQALYMLHRHCICCTGTVYAAQALFCCTGIVYAAQALCFAAQALYLMHRHCISTETPQRPTETPQNPSLRSE